MEGGQETFEGGGTGGGVRCSKEWEEGRRGCYSSDVRERQGTRSWKKPRHAGQSERETWAREEQGEPGRSRETGTRHRKGQGGISGSRETEEEGESSPLPRERKTEPWKMVRMTEVEEVEAGDTRGLQEGGRREEGGIAEGKPWGEGEESGEGGWSGRPALTVTLRSPLTATLGRGQARFPFP